MKVAIPVTNGLVDGPGEGEKVQIYFLEGDKIELVEEYENPALKATAAPGAHMLKSALDKGVNAVVVAEIGGPGVRLLSGKAKIFLAPNMKVEEALKKLIKNELIETDKPTHEHGEHHKL
ncbi:NifB/NifX family molybdenum-iron cluster-binding protein [Acidianus brierleyi]|uniref:Diguanylate cyclase n=1 Tax=Acidianus brierleyi TaxID=41673 RepID=A0A2U9IDN6_9CREN|nr:NifB/NifX family molybdenum-iron cluster-binding protein [Acidianus brierleyi]AWR94153.1 diguanylate cyclase [Acidianus brierleyi]